MVHFNSRLTPERAKIYRYRYIFFSSQVILRCNSSFSFYTWFPHLYKQPSLIIVLTQHISAFPKQERKWMSKKTWNSLSMGGKGRIRRNSIFHHRETRWGGRKENNKLYTTWLWPFIIWRHLQARIVICTLKDSVWTHWEGQSQLTNLLSINTRQRMKGNPRRTRIKGHAAHGTTKARKAQHANQDHSRTTASVSLQTRVTNIFSYIKLPFF